ncbi:hypothetical protein [Amycolatopsis sp. NPDC058986]|uniref:hypothetical protein n=1 Tax=unclassified Amycolatopsis TaxID=2618356 RepID=UPI00366AA9B6
MVAPEKSEPTPKTAQFAVTVRGYNQRQVDERLTELIAQLKEAARGRDEAVATSGELSKALSYAQQELAEAKAALVRLNSSPTGAGAMAERVRMMMQLAEEEAADLRTAAEADATSTREEADKYAHETQRTSDKLAKEAQDEREKLLADTRAEIERLEAEASKKREQLDKAAQDARAEADKKAEEEAAAKRAEADRIAGEEITAKKAQTDAALADATAKQTEADKQRTLALELRAKVAERLAATDAAVQEAVRLLTPSDEAAEPEPSASDDNAPSPTPREG